MSQSEIYTYHLPNGLTLVAEPIGGIRSASFQFLIPAGAATDPEGREGASTLLEGLSYRGAGGKDTRGLSDALDGLGLQRSGGAEVEYTSFGGALLADDLVRALELYADILRRPALPADELEQERELAYQRLDRLEDSPAEKLFVELRRTYFPGPYGRTTLGTREGLASLTAEELRREHARRYRPHGAILSVAGAFLWEELHQTVERLLCDWEGTPPALPPPSTAGRAGYRHVSQETAQEQIGVAYPTAGLGAEGYYEARMAVEVLSGGMAARLFTEVREKRGLVYSVRAVQQSVKGAGFILAYAGTTPERCKETVDVLVGELRRIAEGVTDDELARARTGLLSALIMQGESTRARASALGRDQFLLGHVRSLGEIRRGVEEVTTESIYLYLRDHPPADFTIVTLGPRELEPLRSA